MGVKQVKQQYAPNIFFNYYAFGCENVSQLYINNRRNWVSF